MADIRTAVQIPANTWVLILSAKTGATLYKKGSSKDYISMIFNDAVSDPNTIATLPAKPATAQKIFLDGLIEEVTNSVAIYYWVACLGEKAGEIIKTE